MSFGAGMATGMGAGMGAGIAVGIGSGQENARRKILDYAESHEITVRDKAGQLIPWDEFLHEAVRCGAANSRATRVVAILLGLTLCMVATTLLIWILLS